MAYTELIRDCFDHFIGLNRTQQDDTFKDKLLTYCLQPQTDSKFEYHSHELEHFMDNRKFNSCTFTSVYFDMIHDFGAPAQYLIPFVFEEPEFSIENDSANDCLDNAIITDPKLRTKKTIKKLQHVAGRALNKK